MADYVLARKSRNMASKLVHIFLNLLLGVGSVLITVLSGNPALGLLMVFVSKWRIFAVSKRYLWVNIKSNLADLIVGVSVVLLTFAAGTQFVAVDFILMVFYSVWLLLIKPLSSERATMVQGLITVFLGISATAIMTATLDSIVAVVMAFLVGYAASRHVLVQSSEKDTTLSTLICGLIFAEVMWLSQSWSIIYTFGSSGIRVPQAAIILTILSFVYNYVRVEILKYQDELKFRQIAGPILFGIVLVGVVVICFSNPIFDI